MDARRGKAAWAVAAALSGAAGCAFLYLWEPGGAADVLPACPFHRLTGLCCAGCGATRALHALLHGRVAEALSMNALAALAVPPLFLAACFCPRRLLGKWQPAAALAAIALFFLLRNLPFRPFCLLSPGP